MGPHRHTSPRVRWTLARIERKSREYVKETEFKNQVIDLLEDILKQVKKINNKNK
jgi:hypothetical protein